ncbi:hypothetical protein AVEN_122802-1 [Araneus ventricosus]|uniref:RNA-directed DNA polymerase from mobile element jockey n=1 Tax=Araneus ventricosus TaxID=182803 RepID=A0A4Y2QC57_ARAVE|nr:hypothetical protein AVEN_122802-1 [Araneus ventricosus]
MVPDLPNLQIFGQPFPRVCQYKYLRVTLDSKLSFNKYICDAITKATYTSQKLASLVARWGTLPIRHKLLLYKAIIRPVMMYGSLVWGPTSTTNIRKLQVFQNKQLMHIVKAPWYVRRKVIHDDLKIYPISELSRKPRLDSSIKYPRFVTSCYKDLHTIQLSPVRGNVQEQRWMLSFIISLPSKDEGLIQLLPIWVFKFFLKSFLTSVSYIVLRAFFCITHQINLSPKISC